MDKKHTRKHQIKFMVLLIVSLAGCSLISHFCIPTSRIEEFLQLISRIACLATAIVCCAGMILTSLSELISDIYCKEDSEFREQNSNCKFCGQLDWREYAVPQRNCTDIDNVCQCLSWGRIDGSDETHCYADFSCPENCGGCADENSHFKLFTYENRMGFSYYFKAKNFQIDRNSEMLTINFCPWCGKRLSERLVPFGECVPCSKDGPILTEDNPQSVSEERAMTLFWWWSIDSINRCKGSWRNTLTPEEQALVEFWDSTNGRPTPAPEDTRAEK